MEAVGVMTAVRVRTGERARRLPFAAALTAILALAAVLRLRSFGAVGGNPFYDAAVRSMSLSWHNLFVGAFDPTATTAVDKAPLDLWLQVASVRLLGFSSTALRLPELIAGIAAVGLVGDLGRRLFGAPAGLAAAGALAVLPASVLTARSDTMDAVMMAVVVLAAWCVVRAARAPDARVRWMVAAGAALGLAFNVKLAEALLPLPALLLLAWLALGGGAAARLRALTAGAAAFALVALAWLIALTLAPGPKPFPIGSTDGSAWNVVFVFDGLARLGLARATSHRPGGGPLTLLQTGTGALGTLVGTALVAALAVGLAAVAVAVMRAHGAGRRRAAVDERARLARAGAVCVAVWLLIGVAVFARMVVVYTRYLDAIAPAVALALGGGASALATAARTRRLPVAALALAVATATAVALAVAPPRPSVTAIGCAVATLLAVLAVSDRRVRERAGARGLLALALVGLLAVPAAAAIEIAGTHSSDGGEPGFMPAREVTALSGYLQAHRDGARYEVATMAAASAGALIARDAQPVLILTAAYGRALLTPRQLAAAVHAGRVRFVLAGGAPCVRGQSRERTGCAPVVLWARAHGRDVSGAAGLPRGLLLRVSAGR